jgi:hypothetical protein
MSQDWFKGRYPPSVVEAFTCSVFLEELGYLPDEEISVELSEIVTVVLEAEGRRFRICVGIPEVGSDEFETLLRELESDEPSDEEMRSVLSESKVWQRAPDIAVALREVGFTRAFEEKPVFH